jgi:hypothetical protein
MKIIIKTEIQVEIKTLEVIASVRYWEDAIINGVKDEEGKLTPFKRGNLWCPIIDIDTGIIRDWPKETTAKIHFKICDAGSYFVKDDRGNLILSIEQDYVPPVLCPEEGGYGDYIIMNIDQNGQIKNWKPDFSSLIWKNEIETLE